MNADTRTNDYMHKIGFFIPYFGPLLPWFELFLESCRYNPTIQFYLFNDQSISFEYPPNIRSYGMTMAEFNQLASQRLRLPIQVERPYKICDFKPAFGDIFDSFGDDLDFWGYCDIDIIWGNLRQFLTKDLLDSFDVISAGARFMAGPFSLFRNEAAIKSLYKRSKNVEQVMTESGQFGFEELGPHVTWHLQTGDCEVDRSKEFESFTDLVLAAKEHFEIRAFFGLNYYNDPDIPSRVKGVVHWKNGKLTAQNTDEEFLFYHFQYGKNSFTSWLNADKGKNGFLI